MAAAMLGQASLPVLLRQATLASSVSRLFRTSAPACAGVTEISSDKDFSAIIDKLAETKGLAVVDFTAKWCGPCKFIAPHYEQLAKDYPEIKFLKVDIDNQGVQGTVNDHGITGVPTFTLYRGGHRAESFTGARLDYLRSCILKLMQPS